MPKRDHLKPFSLLILLTFLCAACTPNPVPVTNTTTNTFIPINTATPIPLTPTSALTIVTNRSVTPTITPFPTPAETPYASSEQLHQIENFLFGTETCTVPCWNGVTPGLTSSSGVLEFFTRLGIDVSDKEPFSLGYGAYYLSGQGAFDPELSLSQVAVRWDAEHIFETQLHFLHSYPDFFTISEFILLYGAPTGINMFIGYDGYGRTYTIWYEFAQINSTILFSGRPTRENMVCQSDEELFIEMHAIFVADGLTGDGFIDHVEDFQPVSEFTGISEQELITKILANKCIEVMDY